MIFRGTVAFGMHGVMGLGMGDEVWVWAEHARGLSVIT